MHARLLSIDDIPQRNPQTLAIEAAPLRTALFVDFDNIYRALERIAPEIADHFATHPAQWLTWIEQGMLNQKDTDAREVQKRSVLLRRCYLNPSTAARSRRYFIGAAFTVIDCPFLTAAGKNSADIHMVMDILDTLEHKTHFDEFIILSGDSDFTPVLLRLRAYDRRTVILTVGQAVEAYKAAADLVISGKIFIEEALALNRRTELRVVNATSTTAPLPINAHADGKSSELTNEVKSEVPSANAAPPISDDLKQQIAAYVKQMVVVAPKPIIMAQVASAVIMKFGPQVKETNWLGQGSFKNLLRSIETLGQNIAVSTQIPGYLYDPARHTLPSLVGGNGNRQDLSADLASLAQKVGEQTEIPFLTSAEYALVFTALAHNLEQGIGNPAIVAKAARDYCSEQGFTIGRSTISKILQILLQTPAQETLEGMTPPALAAAFKENIIAHCTSGQLEVTEQESKLLDGWILGNLETSQ